MWLIVSSGDLIRFRNLLDAVWYYKHLLSSNPEFAVLVQYNFPPTEGADTLLEYTRKYPIIVHV